MVYVLPLEWLRCVSQCGRFAGLLLLALYGWSAGGSPVLADAPKRLVLLHGGTQAVDEGMRAAIDRLVVQTLTERAGFSSVWESPVPFEDVELAAGCSGHEATCLQRIASTLEADWLMVRELSRDNAGNIYLTLIAHDGPQARVTRRAIAEISDVDERSAPQRVVPLIIERLYPLAMQPVALPASDDGAPVHVSALPSAPPPASRPDGSRAAITGWSLIGAGAALVVTGTAMWGLSRRDNRSYNAASVDTEREVDRAVALHERAERRSRVGIALWSTGAAAALGGVGTLLWKRARRQHATTGSLEVGMLPAGVGVTFQGAWHGSL